MAIIEASEVLPNLIVVEDNARDMEYLMSSLESLPLMSLEQATRGDEALDMFRQHPDSYLISDVQLPGLNGVELATQVWAITATARIIVWSQYDDEVYLRSLSQVIPPDALYGYVLKNNSSKILQRAVQSVFFEEQCWIDPQVRSAQARSRHVNYLITDAEFEVLTDIALGMTDQLIAQRRFLSKRGVQSRLNSLYGKLGVDHTLLKQGINPRSRAVALALTRGLINQHELEKAESDFVGWQKSTLNNN